MPCWTVVTFAFMPLFLQMALFLLRVMGKS
jgi:hypothetical protein